MTRGVLCNLDSWDVLGLFPGMEPYSDPEVIDALRRFNRTR